MPRDKRLLDAILRQDFPSFIEKVFYTINPQSTYHPNWHIRLIAEYLEEVRKGGIKRLIINMPPRALKSVCVSVAFPAWLLGKKPSTRILAASYSQVLSIKHSIDCRFVLEAPWYKSIFPESKLSRKANRKSKFMTNLNGFRFATSVGGSVTGEGGDYLIIDDPHNPVHMNSKKGRQKTIDWYEQTFSSRLNDQKRGAIILVMQRLHDEDLSSHLLASRKWDHLKIPAIADRKYVYQMHNQYVYEEGEYLNKERDSSEYLEGLQQSVDANIFASQYMQEPLPSNCNLLQQEDICFYEQLPIQFDHYCQSWDTAIKVNENADYSVCTTYGIKGDEIYLVSMLRSKMSYPELKEQAMLQIRRFRPQYILIEDKASGQSLIQDLQGEASCRVEGVRPKLDKITRFASVVPLFQAGRIKLPLKASFKRDLLAELLSFPNSKNDDIVDSISQMLLYHKNKSGTKVARIRSI